MRLNLVLAAVLWASACGEAQPPALRKLEIYATGLEITIDGQGRAQYLNHPTGERGYFSLTARQFTELRRRIEPMRRSRETISGFDRQKLAMSGGGFACNGSYSTDAGGISFHWLSDSIDQLYYVNYGCDAERFAHRNAMLRAILKSLPVPEPVGLP